MSHKFNPSQNLSVPAARLLFAAVVLAFCSHAILAQNGPADPSKELGAPRGSYSQSGYEDLNLYNGRMNITIPLLDIAGRRSMVQHRLLFSWRVLDVPAIRRRESNWP